MAFSDTKISSYNTKDHCLRSSNEKFMRKNSRARNETPRASRMNRCSVRVRLKIFHSVEFLSIAQLLIQAVFIGKPWLVIRDPRISLPKRHVRHDLIAEGRADEQLVNLRHVVPEPRVHLEPPPHLVRGRKPVIERDPDLPIMHGACPDNRRFCSAHDEEQQDAPNQTNNRNTPDHVAINFPSHDDTFSLSRDT